MTSLNKNIEYNGLYIDVINSLLEQIYNIRISGYKYEFVKVFSQNKNILMCKVISDNSHNIKIIIVEIDYLKPINKDIIIKNLYTHCIECGEIHAQHRYNTCGHYVNYLCAYKAINKLNSCGLCLSQIKPVNIKLKTSKEKEICTICLEDCNKQIDNCGHYFHQNCINLHIKKSNECPMCREQLYTSFFKIEKFKNTKFSLGKNKEGLVDIIIKTYV